MSKLGNDYINELFEGILDDWIKHSVFPIENNKMNKITQNRTQVLNSLKNYIMNVTSRNEFTDSFERLSNICFISLNNLNVFVYNINYLKKLLLLRSLKIEFNFEIKEQILNKANEFLDEFMYYITSKYIRLQKETLREQTREIEQSHHDRLSILGQMSSSFVHEFRNPLTSIIGFVKLLKDENSNLPYLEIVSYELEQLNDRITQFLTLSRKEVATQENSVFSLADLIEDVVSFLYPSLVDNNITIFKYIEADYTVNGNRSELRQVILNIIMNSIDALRMTDRNRAINIDLHILSNGHASLTISNNGPQIDGDKLSTIFEPFYTTKDLGTGIGLFVCKQILEKHKGSISCYSNENITKFIIKLPVVNANHNYILSSDF